MSGAVHALIKEKPVTQVINLFGGSGLGKSTTAAGLFYEMKLRGHHCEMVREYVKQWAWDGIKVGQWDQIYLFGKQAKAESRLYGKVDVIVTDCPLLLSPIYESYYSPEDPVVIHSALAFIKKANKLGIKHHNFILERNKVFDTRGRYETEEQARTVDCHVRVKLEEWGIPHATITSDDRDRVNVILDSLGL